MRRLSSFVLLVLAVPVFAAEPTAYTSKEGKYTVRFPGKPTENKQVFDTPAGKITAHMAQLEQAGAAYVTAHNDYPAKIIKDQGVEPTLNGSRDGAVRNTKGKLVKEQKITLGKQKYPGREILVSVADGKAFFRARIYLVGNRLYQAVVTGEEKTVQGKEATAFLDSFKVNE